MIVLAEFSSGNPYFSQNAAVAAKAGSISITSKGTSSFSIDLTTVEDVELTFQFL